MFRTRWFNWDSPQRLLPGIDRRSNLCSFDLRNAQGELIASLMAALVEFERDLLRGRVRSGIAAAQKRRVVFGRRPGQRVKADRYAPKVLRLVLERRHRLAGIVIPLRVLKIALNVPLSTASRNGLHRSTTTSSLLW
jgi:DNA invertase Pin-like site-specific DNA recombinase